MNELLKYFYNHVERLNDFEIQREYNCKSGYLAERAFNYMFPFMSSQVKFGRFKFDFASKHVIYEIKNYMYASTGTADEKLLYSLFKYAEVLEQTKYENIVVVLCAAMEKLYIDKYQQLFMKYELLEQLINLGVFVINMSDLIDDFYNDHKMSLIKWVGGKSKLLQYIVPKLEKHINSDTIYLEPFLGSGAVLISLLEHNDKLVCKVNDINAELINVFNIIKTNPEELIYGLKQLNSMIDEESYYEMREAYNELLQSKNYDDSCEYMKYYKLVETGHEESVAEDYNLFMAILFIYLNKTCFRGLYRVNKSGLMNVPYGHYKSPKLVNESEVRRLSQLFQRVEFYNMSYDSFIDSYKCDNCLIYLDPPYYGTFNDYAANSFNHDHFFNMIMKLKDSYHLVISNSKTFYDKYLDNEFEVEVIDVQDKINSKSPNSKRQEVILTN